MHAGAALPRVDVSAAMPDVFHEMSAKKLGMTTVTSVSYTHLPAARRTKTMWKLSKPRSIRGSWAASSIRNLNPSRSSRIRCSAPSSAPLSSIKSKNRGWQAQWLKPIAAPSPSRNWPPASSKSAGACCEPLRMPQRSARKESFVGSSAQATAPQLARAK